MAESNGTGSGRAPRRPQKASGGGAGKGKSEQQAKSTPQSDRPKPRKGTLEAQLQDAFASLSLMVAMTGDQFSADIVATRSEDLARAWSNLAEKNDAVKRVLKGILEGSAWGEVTVVSLSVAIPIAYRYNLVPPQVGEPFSMMSGVVPPSPEHEEHAERQGQAPPEAEAQQQAAAAERQAAQSEGERRVKQRQAAEQRQQQQQGSGDGDDDAGSDS